MKVKRLVNLLFYLAFSCWSNRLQTFYLLKMLESISAKRSNTGFNCYEKRWKFFSRSSRDWIVVDSILPILKLRYFRYGGGRQGKRYCLLPASSVSSLDQTRSQSQQVAEAFQRPGLWLLKRLTWWLWHYGVSRWRGWRTHLSELVAMNQHINFKIWSELCQHLIAVES